MARQAARNILDVLDGKRDPAFMVNGESPGREAAWTPGTSPTSCARRASRKPHPQPPARPGRAEHTHPFDAKLLVTGGAFTLARDGQATTYGPGDVFSVPPGIAMPRRQGRRAPPSSPAAATSGLGFLRPEPALGDDRRPFVEIGRKRRVKSAMESG
jgi:hypothetical protein